MTDLTKRWFPKPCRKALVSQFWGYMILSYVIQAPHSSPGHMSESQKTNHACSKDCEHEAFPLNPQPHAGGICSASLGQNKNFWTCRILYVAGTTKAGTPLTHTVVRVFFQTPGERWIEFLFNLMWLGRIPAPLNKNTFPLTPTKTLLEDFEKSWIKALR